MALIALLMRPWICMMREIGVTPRTLADDLFLYAAGKDHRQKAEEAMDASRICSLILERRWPTRNAL